MKERLKENTFGGVKLNTSYTENADCKAIQKDHLLNFLPSNFTKKKVKAALQLSTKSHSFNEFVQLHEYSEQKEQRKSLSDFFLRPLLFDQLGHRVQLYVGSSLVDCPNLGVPVELLKASVLDEAHAAHPVDALRRNFLGQF